MNLNLILVENPDKLKSDDIKNIGGLIILFKMHTSGIMMVTGDDTIIRLM